MKTFFITMLVILVAVVGFGFVLDDLLERKINKALTNTEGYQGQVEDVVLNFLDGNYIVKKLNLQQSVNDTLQPFFSVDSVRVSVQWHMLMKGRLESSVDAYRPKLNMVWTEDSTKSMQDAYWGRRFTNTVPFKIDVVNINNGKISYTNYRVSPVVDAYLDSIQATAKDLTNMEDSATHLPVSLTANARTEGQGKLTADMKMDIVNKVPVVHTNFQLTAVDLTQLNDFIKAYGNFDVQQGSLDLYAQMDIKNNSIDGYLKPVFHHLKIFSLKQVDDQSLGKTGFEALLGLGNTLLNDNDKDRLSAKVPIHGKISSFKTDISKALETAMDN